jgi:hypothetical protein
MRFFIIRSRILRNLCDFIILSKILFKNVDASLHIQFFGIVQSDHNKKGNDF